MTILCVAVLTTGIGAATAVFAVLYDAAEAASLTLTGVTGSAYAEHVDAVNTSASLFPLLGIRPQIGYPTCLLLKIV